MTARQVFEGMLTELSKVNAPSLLLLDFNYFFNKAINLYINKLYNIYDINQQTTDDIRVLKSTAVLTPKVATSTSYSKVDAAASSYLSAAHNPIANLYGATYEVELPLDYLHILNCICVYKVNKQHKCYDANSYVQFAAKRLTSDSWSVIINDYFNRPLPERPYFFIHNVNSTTDPKQLPTDPGKTDIKKPYKVTQSDGKGDGDASNFSRVITLNAAEESTVEKNIAVRFGNPSTVRMEIRYGKDNSVFELKLVLIDYVKVPQYIRLTQEQLDLTEDTSQIMEFPDYVCQEIINELVHIVMENTADPRLLTHIPVSQSIANPAQALAQPQAPQLLA